MAKRNTYVTVHNLETGESRTFAPDEELPRWAEEGLTNPDVYDQDQDEEGQDVVPGPSQSEANDLIGGGATDPLMERNKADLLTGAAQWGAEGFSDSNTKAEIIAGIRAAGYDGDGSDLLDGE